MVYIEVETLDELSTIISQHQVISKFAFQDLDFTSFKLQIDDKKFDDCIFLGCKLSDSIIKSISDNCLIFPQIDVPYNPFISQLYSKEMLFDAYKPGSPDSYENSFDKVIYNHFIAEGVEAEDIKETLSRSLHDHSISDALYDFLANYEEKKTVAVMGGHKLSRAGNNYLEIARISKYFTEKGYLMISGGGPGAMEATHVGAWLAGKNDDDLIKAINLLAEAPLHTDKLWLDKAFQVFERYPKSDYSSLGIPTWHYGHEPPTPFASHIAKYFANSIREDGLLAIAKGGVIFTPGSAGTIQEVFQDATQNHYLSFEIASPMVFFDREFWTADHPVYPLLSQLSSEGKYKNLLLSLCDTKEEVIAAVEDFTALK